MSSISQLNTNITELKQLVKGICPSLASGQPAKYVIGVPGAATTKFSLPSRCLSVQFVCAAVPIYGFTNSGASIEAFKVAVTASEKFELSAGPGSVLDLSNFHVFAAAAQSGSTLCAFVQEAAAL